MKLVRNTDNGKVLTLAEIQGNEVTYLHPSIQRMIDKQKCVVLPAIKSLTDQFGGAQKVGQGHEKWAKAVKIYLNYTWVTRAPNMYEWINGEK